MVTDDLKENIFECIKQPLPVGLGVIPGSIPVPFFGNMETAKTATVSINPSDIEFCNVSGGKRFCDRNELRVEDDRELDDEQCQKVYASLINYFNNNPYNWFQKLQGFAGVLFESSYKDGTMVNLDICPWATAKKWGQLTKTEQDNLVSNYDLLKKILTSKEKIFDYVYVNGSEARERLKKLGIRLQTVKTHPVKKVSEIYGVELPNGTKLIGMSQYIGGGRYNPSDADKRTLISEMQNRLNRLPKQ